jgi:hypothetical protein
VYGRHAKSVDLCDPQCIMRFGGGQQMFKKRKSRMMQYLKYYDTINAIKQCFFTSKSKCKKKKLT